MKPRRACTAAAIVFGLLSGTVSPDAAPAATFNADVAPIVFTHCAPCHRPGGSAPFSLLTYDDVRPRASQVATAVRQRTMPPWKPTNAAGTFVGDRRLTDAQMSLIARWVSDGAPRGDPRDLPDQPDWSRAWQLGTPDLVLRLSAPYVLDAGGAEQMRNVILPVPLTETRYVKAWEFATTAPAVVHHATIVVDPARAARQLDAEDPAVGYEGLIPLSAQSPDGYFLGWTPGQSPSAAQPDTAWRLTPGSDLLALLHLRPGSRRETVDVRIGLYFSDRPPSRVPAMVRLNRQDLDIPPDMAHYVATDRYTLPIDVELHAIQPHAHYLARHIRGVARYPDGRTSTLIDIPDWDFHFQDAYRYREPVVLPAGTELVMEWTFDNSTANRANPSRPPRRVTYGQRSTDEMADLWLQVVPREPAALPTLVTSLRSKLLPQHIQGYEMMVQADPNNAGLHDDLALLEVQAGDLGRAAAAFAETVRIRPASAAAHYNLGNVVLMRGRAAEAEPHFRAALARDPAHGLAQQGLGLALRGQGRLAESLVALEEAGRLLPGDPDVHYNLGVVRGERGEFASAVAALRRALAARPRWTAAQAELAWALSVSPDPAGRNTSEALQLAVAAAAASRGQEARVLDVLGVAQAAEGHFEEAIAAAQAALNLLSRTGLDATTTAIAARLTQYRRREPFMWGR